MINGLRDLESTRGQILILSASNGHSLLSNTQGQRYVKPGTAIPDCKEIHRVETSQIISLSFNQAE